MYLQSTQFNLHASNYIDDPADYPLVYGFSYSVGKKDYTASLSLGATSTVSHSSSMFPSGVVFCFLSVGDSHGAFSLSSTNVTSEAYKGTDMVAFASTVLTTNLNSALAASDPDKATQTINMVLSLS